MASMHEWVYYKDGLVKSEDAKLSVASSAVLYGLSVYTVFPVHVTKDNKYLAFRLREHFQRLLNSAKIIGITSFEKEWTFDRFIDAVKEMHQKNAPKKDIYVRATVHVIAEIAGTKSRNLPIALSMFMYDAVPILSPSGSRIKTSSWRRIPDNAIPSRAKVNGAYVNSVLAKQEALDCGYDDCVFLDINGHVCELSAANIFMVRDGVLYTPDAMTDLLEGINRKTVLELADELGIPVKERSIDITELYVADEVFACGTSANISPVLEIDARVIGDNIPGEITRKIQSAHLEARTDMKKYSRWLTVL